MKEIDFYQFHACYVSTKIITVFLSLFLCRKYVNFQTLNQPCISEENLFDYDLFSEFPGMMPENLILKIMPVDS